MTKARAAAAAKLVGLALLLLAAMWLRRPDQFHHPYIWVEDGVTNLPEYIAHGWMTAVQPIPVAGYFSVVMRLLFAAAAALSFRWLPEVSFALTLLFSYAVLIAIAISPTMLRHKFWCAASVLLVPISGEVYGVSLYVLWWASLLAFLPLFWSWSAADQHRALRATFLSVGGLSSPIAIGLLPLYGARYYRSRARSDLWLAVLCAGLAAVQGMALLTTAARLDGQVAGRSLVHIVAKFFGAYVFWTAELPDSPLYPALGVALIAVIITSACVRRSTLDWTLAALTASIALAIALSLARVPASVMHPILAGGRYFFFPFVLLSWLLLYLLDTRHQATTVFCAAALLLSVRTTLWYGQMTHPSMGWRAHVEACVTSTSHTFPVQYAGDAHDILWKVELTGDACRRLVRDSAFDNQLDGERFQDSQR